jgi:hypothetical protein
MGNGEEEGKLTGTAAAKPHDEPVVGARDRVPERMNVRALQDFVVKPRPPGDAGNRIVRVDRTTAEVVRQVQHLLAEAGITQRLAK